MRTQILVLAALFAGLVAANPQVDRERALQLAGPVDSVRYVAPIDAPILDAFRPPDAPYGPGNRGLEYDSAVGDVVVAAADGEVTFAGAIGDDLYVTVVHADGVSTTYSFLARIEVSRGDQLIGGAEIGTTKTGFHFGAKRVEEYLDPTILLDASQGSGDARHAVLVPANGGGGDGD